MRITLIASLLTLCTGCLGVAPFGSQANPETRVRMAYDPFTGTYDVFLYTNDGRAMKLNKMTATVTPDGAKSIDIDGLEITERSVENREANVLQIQAQAEMARVFMESIERMIPTIGKTIVESQTIQSRNNLDRINDLGKTFNDNPLVQPDGPQTNP